MPQVSVIIPVYDVEKYLYQCMNSLVHQSLYDIEIICIDDGSTDNSLAILQEYAQRDSRIVVLQQKNQGAGIARNAGMKIAQGEYLAIVDSDDFFEPDMLEKAYKKCEQDKADFCVFRSDQYDQKHGKYIDMHWTIKQRYLPENIPFSAEDIYSHIFQLFNGWSWDKLYRRDFVEKNGLQFQELRTTNDAFFVFMTNVQAKRITIVDEVLAHHRVNTKTSLSVTREKSWDCCWQAINAIREELLVRNQYKLVEQSFVNWAVHFLLWNVRTLKDSSKEKLMEEIRTKYSKVLQFASYKPEYFYDKKEYQEFLAICQSGEYAKLQENVFRKTLHYLKENGLKATMHKIKSVIMK